MTLRTTLGAAMVAATLAVASAARATVVFDTGAPVSGSGGNEATLWIQANSFSLGAAAAITGGGVYVGTYTGDTASWDGTFTYYIFDDASGKPGNTLATATVTPTVSDTGIAWCCGGKVLLFEFDLASAFDALVGVTYWLGIHLAGDFNDRDELYWVRGDVTGVHAESLRGTQDNWAVLGPRHTFYLTGREGVAPIPLPGGLPLLAGGIAAFALLRARRRT
jgi:hypothetical protein